MSFKFSYFRPTQYPIAFLPYRTDKFERREDGGERGRTLVPGGLIPCQGRQLLVETEQIIHFKTTGFYHSFCRSENGSIRLTIRGTKTLYSVDLFRPVKSR